MSHTSPFIEKQSRTEEGRIDFSSGRKFNAAALKTLGFRHLGQLWASEKFIWAETQSQLNLKNPLGLRPNLV